MSNSGLPRTLLSRIEDAGLNASAPPQQVCVDGWLVRLSPGNAHRSRCTNALSHSESGKTTMPRPIRAACNGMMWRICRKLSSGR